MEHKRSYGVKDTIQTVLVSCKNTETLEKIDIFLCHRLKFFFCRKTPLGDIAMYPMRTNVRIII